MKKFLALVMTLVSLFTCSAAFAVTHYSNNGATGTQEGFSVLLNREGLVVGALKLDEFTSKIQSGSLKPVSMNAGSSQIKEIVSNGRIIRCKNLKSVAMNEDKSQITAGESYLYATWEVKNQAILNSLKITTLAQLVENTKFSLTINGKDYAGHRFIGTDAGTEVARIYVGKAYISVRYADWDDGVKNNLVLCFRAGSYDNGGNNSQETNPKPTQPPTQDTKPTQAPTQKPTQAPTQKPTQAPAATPKPEYQEPILPPTLDDFLNNGDSSSNSNPSDSGNVPNPEYQQGTLPGDLGDFWGN